VVRSDETSDCTGGGKMEEKKRYVQIAIYPETHKLLKILSETLGMSGATLVSHALAFVTMNIEDFVRYVSSVAQEYARALQEAMKKLEHEKEQD
jgi:predicted DNA-binding protein